MRKSKSGVSAGVILLLAACGGGGGGGGGGSPAPSPTPGSSLVSSVATGTYTNPSEELAAFNLVNAERSRCGFGMVAQSTQIDLAARDHALYQLKNNLYSHFQDSVNYPTGFTGTNAKDRLVYRSYSDVGTVTDEYAGTSVTNKAGRGADAVRRMLSGPYHMNGMLGGYRDIGVAVANDTDAGSTATTGARTIVQFNLAFKAAVGKQLMAGDAIATYPCEGTTGTMYTLNDETPNPVPGRNLSTNPLGQGIYIKVRDGNTLTISSVSMVATASGTPVTLRATITSANDPHNVYTGSEAYSIPDAPLALNTQYTVTINGTNNGTGFTRVFKFTTGNLAPGA